jgi:hypothetical protein
MKSYSSNTHSNSMVPGKARTAILAACLAVAPGSEAFHAVSAKLQMPGLQQGLGLRVSTCQRGLKMVAAAPAGTSTEGALAKVGKKPWMSEDGLRAITNAEVLSVTAVTGNLSEEDLLSWLGKKGYRGETRDAMLAKVLTARRCVQRRILSTLWF